MDVKDIVRDALTAMEDAEVPDDLRSAALPAIIALVAQRAPGSPSTALATYEEPAPRRMPSENPLQRLATKLNLPLDVVESVYTSDGSTIDISVNPGRLPRSRSTGTKVLALLVTAHRQAGDEEFTPIDEIRRVVQDYDRYDQPNFASSIGEMRGAFLVRGRARQRSVKLTRPGWQQATDLVLQLGGPE